MQTTKLTIFFNSGFGWREDPLCAITSLNYRHLPDFFWITGNNYHWSSFLLRFVMAGSRGFQIPGKTDVTQREEGALSLSAERFSPSVARQFTHTVYNEEKKTPLKAWCSSSWLATDPQPPQENFDFALRLSSLALSSSSQWANLPKRLHVRSSDLHERASAESCWIFLYVTLTGIPTPFSRCQETRLNIIMAPKDFALASTSRRSISLQVDV